MAASSSSCPAASTPNTARESINIPVEIVSEEEMAFIEAALASTRPLLSSSSFSCTSLSSTSSPSRLALSSSLPSILSPRRIHAAARSRSPTKLPDIEDSPAAPQPRSLLQQFRSRRGLAVTDVTATEWCEKQMEFVLLCGKPKKTEAMKAGSARHIELEEEVIEKVEIRTESVEESWAVRLLNFIVGANQLLFEGLTRELPVVGVVEGIWMIGVIDEIRIPIKGAILNPLLVDTKTRYKATVPSEAQKRNARLQLMCYKHLWDSLVGDSFPTDYFFNHFHLKPQHILSEDIKQYVCSLGFDAKNFGDVVTYFRDTCCLLSQSQEQLLLRYELQLDRSLLEEYQFAYDAGWFKNQIQECLRFWLGERGARYVCEGEKWKCRFCTFATTCPMTAKPSAGTE